MLVEQRRTERKPIAYWCPSNPSQSMVPGWAFRIVMTLTSSQRSRLGDCKVLTSLAVVSCSEEQTMSSKRRGSKNAPKRGCVPVELPKMHANAAGIDIGAEEIWVAVPADRSATPIRRVGKECRSRWSPYH